MIVVQMSESINLNCLASKLGKQRSLFKIKKLLRFTEMYADCGVTPTQQP